MIWVVSVYCGTNLSPFGMVCVLWCLSVCHGASLSVMGVSVSWGGSSSCAVNCALGGSLCSLESPCALERVCVS